MKKISKIKIDESKFAEGQIKYAIKLMEMARTAGIKRIKEKTINKIDDLIDHYEPYRPITDSPEAKEVRKVLAKLKKEILKIK